ncbi:hypothetical protein AI2668V1_2750 [Citrobacter freundii]|nr:hypothetical protein AI2666V1_2747 [Citrobacter freundii]CAE7419129.1 hypothetical protein AI2668V1_2750 [Citrobacter freundii]CAH3741312.1 hypothetical protein AI2668V1_2750 [Citrobacter freundii]CAH3741832.1 hypothetical protein AI2666V1_2747 [Citrobacter freundii]CAH3944734.1 hypothetical protein AI2680V1_4377 [Citrobacter freundii]
MTPSSGDTLLCFVKRAVPERTKEKTGTAKAMAVVVGLSLRRMINLTIRCPQLGKVEPGHTCLRAISRITTTLRALPSQTR